MGTKNETIRFGLIGKSLDYSFSKNYFEKNNLDNNYSYTNFEFESETALASFLLDDVFFLHGFNVTIPYKQTIIPYLDELDTIAEETQAVNTVLVKNGKLIGYNTDVIGFQNSISKLIKSKHKKALILGTGGASKAIAYALSKLKIQTTSVSRIPIEKATLSYSALNKEHINSHKIIINTTPLGTFPIINECPNIPYQFITKNHLVYDLVYNPNETLFLYRAKEQGATIKNGLEMLEIQAEAAWRIWS